MSAENGQLDVSGKTHELKAFATDLSTRLKSLTETCGGLDENRNSYMDLKINSLLEYSILFTSNILNKADGNTHEELNKSLIKLRCLIERLKPFDVKLQYQLDKIAQGAIDAELKFKPNPTAMDSQLHISDKPGVYQPPKLQAAIYDEKPLTKEEKEDMRMKKRLARSTLIQSLKEELNEEPELIHNVKNKRLREWEEERTTYEEANFTRLQVTKKDKYIRKRLEDKEDEEENIGDLLKMTQKTKEVKKNIKKNIQYSKNKKRPRKDNDFGIKSV